MFKVLVQWMEGKAVAFRADKPDTREDGKTPEEAYGKFLSLHPDPLTPLMEIVSPDGTGEPQPI